MQKVKSLEQNLSVLEYIKELNRREGSILPELDKELSRISLLLEKSRAEIKDLLEWKEIMEKGITDLELWKTALSSQVQALARENDMLKLDVENRADKSGEQRTGHCCSELLRGICSLCEADLRQSFDALWSRSVRPEK